MTNWRTLEEERSAMANVGLLVAIPVVGLVLWIGPDVFVDWFTDLLHGRVSVVHLWWGTVAVVGVLVVAAVLGVRRTLRPPR